jgi:hypothetical protein
MKTSAIINQFIDLEDISKRNVITTLKLEGADDAVIHGLELLTLLSSDPVRQSIYKMVNVNFNYISCDHSDWDQHFEMCTKCGWKPTAAELQEYKQSLLSEGKISNLDLDEG